MGRRGAAGPLQRILVGIPPQWRGPGPEAFFRVPQPFSLRAEGIIAARSPNDDWPLEFVDRLAVRSDHSRQNVGPTVGRRKSEIKSLDTVWFAPELRLPDHDRCPVREAKRFEMQCPGTFLAEVGFDGKRYGLLGSVLLIESVETSDHAPADAGDLRDAVEGDEGVVQHEALAARKSRRAQHPLRGRGAVRPQPAVKAHETPIGGADVVSEALLPRRIRCGHPCCGYVIDPDFLGSTLLAVGVVFDPRCGGQVEVGVLRTEFRTLEQPQRDVDGCHAPRIVQELKVDMHSAGVGPDANGLGELAVAHGALLPVLPQPNRDLLRGRSQHAVLIRRIDPVPLVAVNELLKHLAVPASFGQVLAGPFDDHARAGASLLRGERETQKVVLEHEQGNPTFALGTRQTASARGTLRHASPGNRYGDHHRKEVPVDTDQACGHEKLL